MYWETEHVRGVWELLPLVLLSIVGVAHTEMCAGWCPSGLKLPSKKLWLNRLAQVLEIVKLKSKLTKSARLAMAQLE